VQQFTVAAPDQAVHWSTFLVHVGTKWKIWTFFQPDSVVVERKLTPVAFGCLPAATMQSVVLVDAGAAL